jgi:hypothetical protein
MSSHDEIDDENPEAEIVQTDTDDQADPASIIDSSIPTDLLSKYRFASYGRALSILVHGYNHEFIELMDALRRFQITVDMIRKPGGNESDIPKVIAGILRPEGWHETTIVGDLLVRRRWKEVVGLKKNGKFKFHEKMDEIKRLNFFDGHKIDFVKGRVAFDFEWNSKDQTFDRDLYAFNAFATAGAVDVAVIVTRDYTLNSIFSELGYALNKDGTVKTEDGKPVKISSKYGASTTWWGKLIYRLNAGRNGACPVLAIGIKPECISDLSEWRSRQSGDSAAEL